MPRWDAGWTRADSNQGLDGRQVNDPQTCSEDRGKREGRGRMEETIPNRLSKQGH